LGLFLNKKNDLEISLIENLEKEKIDLRISISDFQEKKKMI